MNERLPVAIWNARQAALWRSATREQQDAWDAYAEEEAKLFNANPSLDSYDSTATMTSYDKEANRVTDWAPPMTFEEFVRWRP